MEIRQPDSSTMQDANGQPKGTYDTPRLAVYGTIQDLTGNPGGQSIDGFGGSAPII